jgi:IstB-like ATP binding protein
LIVTNNKVFARWGEVFGDDVVAAMIDRLVHHADVISLKGDSYQLKDRDLDRPPPAPPKNKDQQTSEGQNSSAVDMGRR